MEYKEMLKSPIFHNIKQEELQTLLPCLQATVKEYQKEETILNVGNNSQYFGLILSGKVLVVKEDYWGNRMIINELEKGELFGEAYACISTKELEVNVIAKEKCQIMFLSVENIIASCHHNCIFHQQILRNLLQISAQKNIMLTQKMEHITKRSIRKKVLSYLSSQILMQDKNRIRIPFNRQELADYLAVDRSALSLELSKMKKEGILSYYKNEFEVK